MTTIVPEPLTVEDGDGAPFLFGVGTRVLTGDSPAEITIGVMFAGMVGGALGLTVAVEHGPPERLEQAPAPGTIVLRIDPHAGPSHADAGERYRLESRHGGVVLAAPTAQGLVRAIATFGQLAHPTATGEVLVPAVTVDDAPRYPWRGLSLDVARHFFSVGHVKAVLGLMCQYKLNVLHLHVTDDQGWRLQIPSRPALTELSSGSAVGGGPGGYFTVEDYVELQAYGEARGVTVVPEIDLPGHTNAALHAYPELTATGRAPGVYTGIEVGFSTLDASLPATEEFLRDVLGDVAAMTRGPWIHIGGDEALGTAAEDYLALVGLAAEVVRAAGKVPVAWQEFAVAPAAADGALVQLWDHRIDTGPLQAATSRGARVVLSPANRVYLDMKYDAATPIGLDWAGTVELEDSYVWEPSTAVPGLAPDAIAGVEAAVWTETIEDFDQLSTMLLPRLAAVAEVAWSAPERRSWPGFAERIRQHGPRWDRQGLRWHRSAGVDW